MRNILEEIRAAALNDAVAFESQSNIPEEEVRSITEIANEENEFLLEAANSIAAGTNGYAFLAVMEEAALATNDKGVVVEGYGTEALALEGYVEFATEADKAKKVLEVIKKSPAKIKTAIRMIYGAVNSFITSMINRLSSRCLVEKALGRALNDIISYLEANVINPKAKVKLSKDISSIGNHAKKSTELIRAAFKSLNADRAAIISASTPEAFVTAGTNAISGILSKLSLPAGLVSTDATVKATAVKTFNEKLKEVATTAADVKANSVQGEAKELTQAELSSYLATVKKFSGDKEIDYMSDIKKYNTALKSKLDELTKSLTDDSTTKTDLSEITTAVSAFSYANLSIERYLNQDTKATAIAFKAIVLEGKAIKKAMISKEALDKQTETKDVPEEKK